ncbi:MAG: hypothetical protein K2N78_01470 [Oscillospiraceae bacterium]|nr:hypothetical protein [Oscillospiraceae bacterium]
MELNEIFTPFYEDDNNGTQQLLASYQQIRHRAEEAQPDAPIVFLDPQTDEERAVLNNVLALAESSGAFASFTSPTAQKQVPQPPVIPQEPPAPVAAPFAPPMPTYGTVERSFFNSALSALESAAEGIKESTVDLMNLFLRRIPLREYSGELFYFENGVYHPLPRSKLRSLIFYALPDIVRKQGSPKFLGQVAELLNSNAFLRVPFTTETPNRIYFSNGVWELGENTFRPVNGSDFFTSYVAVEYPSGPVRCPVFDQYLSTSFGGDATIIESVWEIVGYILSTDMSAKMFFVLEGVGDSGKSVLCSLISSFFNPEAVAYLDIFRFKERFTTHALKGKRLNVCSDLPHGKISREAIGIIKQITGGDTIAEEGKFAEVGALTPTCKLLFGTNFALSVADADAAFAARLVTIPFRFAVPKEQQDPALLVKLLAERPAIAIRAIEAYTRFRDRGYQLPLVRSNYGLTTYGYTPTVDVFTEFVQECCIFDPEGYTPVQRLHEAYIRFCQTHSQPPIQDRAQFSRQLNLFCAGRISAKKKRVAGEAVNGYVGIRLAAADGP